METRRSFIGKAALAGIAGIAAAKAAPGFAQNIGMLKIGQLGLGSHGFVGSFLSPPADMAGKIKAYPYAVWDDYPGVAVAMKNSMGFQKVIDDPAQLVNESDVVHVEHSDYRKVLELARPALEQGKPVFINRPFAYTIAESEEIVRLAKEHNAPLMSASSLEFQPEVALMQQFMKDKGPIRAYEAYCGEQHFTWMFPHVINYAHAAFGGGIDTAYFDGTFNMDVGKWADDHVPFGSSLCILKWKSVNGQPPLIGMNHIGDYPGAFHINAYGAGENKTFTAGSKIFEYMFRTLHAFYAERTIPRPYEAILEEHRALVATAASRLSGKAVSLASLGGSDALPYSDNVRGWVIKNLLGAYPVGMGNSKSSPKELKLGQNSPNPFNPTTTISYEIPKASFATIIIYNSIGQEVKTLVNRDVQAGKYTATWNGKDNDGNSVTSGIYFYKVKAGQFEKTMKMTLIK
ncbi:MAG: FlgD immunoglobulin-like domain containing protein [Candidatus Latescibacterota bacterium]